MSHNTKQIICHWYLDGFKPESEYYTEVRAHFDAQELARIDGILAQAYNPEFVLTQDDLNFIMRVLKKVIRTSVPGGAPEDDHEYE